MYKYKHQQRTTPFCLTLKCHHHPEHTAEIPPLAPIPGMTVHQNLYSVTVRTNSPIGTGITFHIKTYRIHASDQWEYHLSRHGGIMLAKPMKTSQQPSQILSGTPNGNTVRLIDFDHTKSDMVLQSSISVQNERSGPRIRVPIP
jgi:hypothetical protein